MRPAGLFAGGPDAQRANCVRTDYNGKGLHDENFFASARILPRMNFSKWCALALLSSVAGCASIPSSGPTGSQILKSSTDPENRMPISVVELGDVANIPAPSAIAPSTLPDLPPPPTDMVGPGDVLDIAIYEAGVTLFGGGSTPAAAAAGVYDPSAKVEKLPPSRVDDEGYIAVPFAGKIHVLGHTVSEISAMVRKSLLRFSQNPQVLVTLREAITNSVIVGGDVARPGRLVLPTNRETLSDAIALAGGYRGEDRDLAVRVQRNSRSASFRVNEVLSGTQSDIRVYPGDRITVISQPRTYTVLGASGKVDRLPFATSKMKLVEAIASAGGTNPGLGDPKAIFVFRYVPDETGADKPVVYHLNMMNAGSYFLAQRFEMRDGDVLYFGNASSNQPTKMIQLISQLFSPILTVTSAVQVVQNSGN